MSNNEETQRQTDHNPEANGFNSVPIWETDFRIAWEARNFEITQLVNRNNFFMIFQGVLLAAVLQSEHTIPLISFLVCVAGFSISILQVGMAAGAKYWQIIWEQRLRQTQNWKQFIEVVAQGKSASKVPFGPTPGDYKNVSKDLDESNTECLTKKLILMKPSVSKVPIYVGIVCVVVWFFLLSSTIAGPFEIPKFIVGFPK